ncbi:MAG: hypothetical protein DMF70_02290 [Acidobacteria bacterium]|nr:MAG: hypothetical protein DMF70_02290 [Acidobacteriota bacterium]
MVGEKSFGAGAEQELFTLRDGDGLLLTTIKWASASGKPFLGEDRNRSGVTPSVEVKRPESPDVALDVEDPNNDEESKPNQTPVKPTDVAPKPEDTQLKKALELLRDKTAAAQRAP